jgi:Na+/H+-dicarboxylate symporter
MKKTIKFIILPIIFLTFLTPIVFAQDQTYDFQLNQNKPLDKFFEDELSNTNTNQTSDQVGGVSINANDVPKIIQKIALWLYRVVLALSVIFGLYAALLYLSGNPKNVEKAHQQLKYAFIGVAIAIVSFSIETIIMGIISR